jgi:hypothetical protein
MTRACVLVQNYRSDANSERGLAVYGYPCLRSGHKQVWRPQGDSNPRYRRERAMS